MPRGTALALSAAWMIRAQHQGRRFRAQLLLPEAQLVLGLALGEPLALPTAVVGVLQGQRRQLGELTLGGGGVQAGEFFNQHIHRPAVGDDVVQCHQQLMVILVETQQADPQQRPLLQIERRGRFVFSNLPRPGFAQVGRQVAEIDDMQLEFTGRIDLLQGHAIPLQEPRAQGLMTLDQLLETGAQRVFVQLAAQVQGARNVVGMARRIELPGKPQTVLGQGLRQRIVARQCADRALRLAAVLLLVRHRCGERGQGWRFEQQAQVQFQPQGFP
ncbi:hypothetical protein PFLU4_58650 [Pseudomonas fluorescens]|nr:hypothetical protein PFLU4_58650 [Pseudomonas fluorescens]